MRPQDLSKALLFFHLQILVMDFLPFRVPRKLLDAEQESSDSLYVRECKDFSVMQPREITETLKGISLLPDSFLRVFHRHSRFYVKLREFMPLL